MRYLTIVLLMIPALAPSLFAKDLPARERGVLAEMQSVSCGYMQKTGTTVAGAIITGAQHTKSRELLCQEYVLKTDRVTYRIRPKEEKHPVLLRVGDEAEFRLKKDEMLLRVPETDNKEREYIVVSMVASTEFSNAISQTQHPPKPHGVKLDANATASDPQPPPPPPSPTQATDPPLTASVQPPSAVATAKLEINSTPAGAEIFLDSSSAGHTPARLAVKPGQHSVQLVLSGYRDWVTTVNATPGTQQELAATLAK